MKARKNLSRPIALLALLLCAILHSPAVAQIHKPRLMLNTDGPIGTVRRLAFSHDGRTLYAAGAGKVVNAWQIDVQEGVPSAIPLDPLRWEIARSLRGAIYSLEGARDDAKLVVGGYGARDATGDVVVFDQDEGQIDYVLPVAGAQPRHLQTVVSVDISPDGSQVASMSLDGQVILWRNRGATGREIQKAGNLSDRVHSLAFVGGSQLLFPMPDRNAPDVWRLASADLTTSNPTITYYKTPDFDYGISAIAVAADQSEIAVSDHQGAVTLLATSTSGTTRRPLSRPRELGQGVVVRKAASLAYNNSRLLAVTTTADGNGACWLELWQTSANPPTLVLQRPLGSKGEAAHDVAFSPDGRLLAVTRADHPAVELVSMQESPLPLETDRMITLSGRGRQPHAARFVGTDGYRIDVEYPPPQTAADLESGGVEDFYFDLQTLEALQPDTVRETDTTASSKWQLNAGPIVERNGRREQDLEVIPPDRGTPPRSITLSILHQGEYASDVHAWLIDPTDESNVYGVAIATRTQNGIFIYDLHSGRNCRLMRYLRDHRDTIHSLDVSADGRYLVSASADQTVKIWSLTGLRGVNETFAREDAWGATFAVENDNVIVESAVGAGIAVHRDLLAKDVVTSVTYAGADGPVTTADAGAILELLTTRPLWETMRFVTERDGQRQLENAPITPAWEPIATLFVDSSEEWALWTPQGIYDCSANGDRLFGWHINVARDQSPQFFRAEKFRPEFEKPSVMRELLRAGSLQDALIAVAAGQAPKRPPTIGDVAASIPRMRLVSPRSGLVVRPGESITVEAAVAFPEPENRENYLVQLWVNDRLDGEPHRIAKAATGETRFFWSVPPAGERNKLVVELKEGDGGRIALRNDTSAQVTADVQQSDISIHLFSLAASGYEGDWALKNPVNDVEGLARLLREFRGRRHATGEVDIVTDKNGAGTLSRDAVRERIASFLDRLSRLPSDQLLDDILVVHVVGHGIAFQDDDGQPVKYYFVPSNERLTSDLRDRRRGDELQKVVEQIGIPWEDIRVLADVKCRKVFVLDTCYSGNVTLAEKGATRPLADARGIVFASTSKDSDARAQHPTREGHALFTGYLLDACEGKADGSRPHPPINPEFVPRKDQQIDLKEVVSYVSLNTRKYLQQPTCAPSDLLEFVDLPLFNVVNETSAAIDPVAESELEP